MKLIHRIGAKIKSKLNFSNPEPSSKDSDDWFTSDFKIFVERSLKEDPDRFDLKNIQKMPFLHDKTITTSFDPHYIYHPAWAARVLKDISPSLHIDIGSTLHFSTQLSAFIPTKFYDYRPVFLNLPKLTSESADLTNLFFKSNEVESISCMHTIEHIGLGRYGDNLDPRGDIKAMNELERVVKPGGSLLLVTPVGKPKIAFNGHRIYSYESIIENFKSMDVVDFSLIPDNAVNTGMIFNCSSELVKEQEYGCGCFFFRKRMP